jgi:GT2 family glycosyltransferase
MQRARGEFIALLDSDDLWSRDYLARQTALLDRHREASVVTANATNLGGAKDGTPFWPVSTGLRRLTFRDIIREEDAVCIMSVFRRSVLDATGGFDTAFITNEDYQFWLRVARLGFVILQNRTPLGQYRRRHGSLSDDERRMLSGIIHVLWWARAESLEHPLDVAAIDAQIERFEKQLLFTKAKAHLVEREFDKAADAFSALSALDGRLASELVAQASRHAPGTLRLAYRGMTALRAGAAAGRLP